MVQDAKWNFAVLLLETWIFSFAVTFFDVSTICPVFVSRITTSSLIIGLIVAIRSVSFYLPQLLAAKYLTTKKLKKTFLVLTCFLGRLPLGIFSLIMILFGLGNPSLTLILFFFALASFHISEGTSSVSWLDIIGKVIPSNRRGLFFGLVQVGGGVLAIGGGGVVNYLLSSPFPTNYTLVFTLSFSFLMLSVLFLSLIRERPGTVDSHSEGLMDYLKRMPKILKENQAFKRLAIIQILVNCSSLATPFYIIYVINNLSMGDEVLGLLVLAQVVGRTVFGLILAFIGDRWSKKAIIRMGIGLVLAVPVSIIGVWLISLRLPLVDPLIAYILIFALYGASLSILFVGFINFLLEILEPAKRPTGIGLMNTLNSFSTLMPLLGGLIAGYVPLEVIFLITIIPVSASMIFARKL